MSLSSIPCGRQLLPIFLLCGSTNYVGSRFNAQAQSTLLLPTIVIEAATVDAVYHSSPLSKQVVLGLQLC